MNKAVASKPSKFWNLDKIDIPTTTIITFTHPRTRIEAHIVCKNVCIISIFLLYSKTSHKVKKKYFKN